MIRIFDNSNVGKLTTLTSYDQIYFIGCEAACLLGYENPRDALAKHVSEKYKVKVKDVKGVAFRDALQAHQTLITEPGLYSLVFSSKLPAAELFRDWVFEKVLPDLRKCHKFDTPNKLVFKIENESDLHTKVIEYTRKYYPQAIIIAGLGELQNTSQKRIDSWKKGYTKGQPDIVIANLHKNYNGLCIELKTPKGTGVLSDAQRNLLEKYEKNGYKTLVSNDYDHLLREITEYCQGIRITCPHCCQLFVNEVTLKSHCVGFHRISTQCSSTGSAQ